MLRQLTSHHEVLVAKSAVSSQQIGPLLRGQLLPPPPEALTHRLTVELLARRYHHIQRQPEPRNEKVVIGVRRPSMLVRVVTHFGSFLPSINRFDCHINVANPCL